LALFELLPRWFVTSPFDGESYTARLYL